MTRCKYRAGSNQPEPRRRNPFTEGGETSVLCARFGFCVSDTESFVFNSGVVSCEAAALVYTKGRRLLH